MQKFKLLPAVVCLLAPALTYGQFSFKIGGRDVQVHSFASQGFAKSDNNNYLTMKTKDGSFAMTDVGVNASIAVTDKLRIGAQFYTRNIGNLGQWEPQLDWAMADYRFKDWFGIRGGVVKTVFGLHNDTQDMEFLHTNALLPQSIYPTDLRDALIRHRGGDVYGTIPLKKAGSLAYTAFAGNRKDSENGGYIYLVRNNGIGMNTYGGTQYGGDLRWNTPIPGLLMGYSHMRQEIEGNGTYNKAPYKEWSKKDQANQAYAQYTVGKLRVEGEYRRWWRDQAIMNGTSSVRTDTRAWYLLASYRFMKRLEVGSYYSRLVNMWIGGRAPAPVSQNDPTRHLFDKVVTARVDLNSHWNVKVEGHFMDGNGSPRMYPVGFYNVDNPTGMKPQTKLLVLRTGVTF